MRIAELDAASFSRRQRRLCALRNHLALMLGHGG
jgi:hypothetical protein